MSTNLPVELIEKILRRLPPKSLFRFKSVSKSCRDLIQSPDFVNSHLKRSPQRILVLNNFDDKKIKKIHFFDRALENFVRYELGNYSFIHFVGSCNGLVCLFDVQYNIVICNVATREHLMIPYPSNLDDRIGYGFGYDTMGYDYKVVLIERFCDSEIEILMSISMVYSLKQNKWTRSVHDLYSCVHRQGVFVNGFMHWAIYSKPKRGIVAFDLQSERFCGQVPLPDLTRCVMDVGVLRGCLLMTEKKSYAVCLSDELGVWMMKDYMIKDSWTKLYSVNHVLVPCAMSSDDIPLIPLSSGCLFWQRYQMEKKGKIQTVGCWVQLADSVVYGESVIQISAYAGLPGTRGEPTIEVRGAGSSSNEQSM
ncbi:putative F-box family protein [Tripterygium wilfordii]|uniref:Putative F-box family protein n=1 Tax=Tripterygium wilfordii TaxID=458696 RepID=A0A7J7C335_TRIWF|nr:F-box protein CPR1-like [Tripterygium wilfordii]KAF5728542.1 putative F-box family protein [Tripterygium wilfordii]